MLPWEHTRAAIEAVLPKVAAVTAPLGGVMVGGSAIALQLQHRASFDIDVLMLEGFDSAQIARRFYETANSFIEGQVTPHVFAGNIDGVEVGVWKSSDYQVPIESGPEFGGMPVASLPDLFAMKLRTVRARPQVRDYFDIAVLMDRVMPLEDGVRAYARRYGLFLIYDDLADVLSVLTPPPRDLQPDPLYAEVKDDILPRIAEAADRVCQWLTENDGNRQTGNPPPKPRIP